MTEIINFDELKNAPEDVFTVETEDGEVNLKIIDEMDTCGKTYALLVVLDDYGDETDEAAVFELKRDEDGNEIIESVDDEWLLDELFEEFGVGAGRDE